MFKPGQYYAIQAEDKSGMEVFCEVLYQFSTHADRLRSIARNAARSNINDIHSYEDDYEITTRNNPFGTKLWPINSDVTDIIHNMRIIRKYASKSDIDPNSLKIVVINCSVESYVPESPSDEETELRRFVLEKLNKEEKRLLKVEHWDVYNKLADRSMIDDSEDPD